MITYVSSELQSSGLLRSEYYVISYRRFGTTYLPYSRVKKMGPIGCPETSVRNYDHSLRNNPEEPKITHLVFIPVGSNTIKLSLQ